MTIEIREAQGDDRSRLIDLFQALNRHEDGVTGDRRTDRTAAEENLDHVLSRIDRCGGLLLVAEVEGAVAGLVAMVFQPGDIYVREEVRAYAQIADLVVDEGYRRLGIGRRLMAAAEQAALSRGYRRLVISVLAGNEAAERAYASQGFRPLAHDLEKRIG